MAIAGALIHGIYMIGVDVFDFHALSLVCFYRRHDWKSQGRFINLDCLRFEISWFAGMLEYQCLHCHRGQTLLSFYARGKHREELSEILGWTFIRVNTAMEQVQRRHREKAYGQALFSFSNRCSC